MLYVPFATQSVEAGYSRARLKNLFARQTPQAVAPVALMGRSGLRRVRKLRGSVRAFAARGDTLFIASGGELYSYSGGTLTSLASIVDGPSQMIATASHVVVLVSGQYYVWDGARISAPSLGALTNPRGVAYLGGYTIVIGDSGGRGDAFTYSALDDPTSFNALDFAFAESNDDRLNAIVVDHAEVWLMGERSIETWRNTGAASNPFQRNPGGILERGCIERTAAKEDNGVFWVGRDRVVYRSDGVQLSAISTREVDEVLEGATITGAFVFKDRGHKFYVVQLRDRPSYAYDMTTQAWCEFSTGVGEGEFIATTAMRVGSTEYVGASTGALCTLGGFTDDGQVLEAEAISTPVAQPDFLSVSRLTVNVDTGDAGAQESPKIVMQVSKDGRTWGQERWRDLGAVGDYHRRAAWHGLGAMRRLQVRLRITDECSRDIMGVAYD
jgi:hypothetical protein